MIALVALADWFIALSFFHSDALPLTRLFGLACPGNGFAAYCRPLGLLVFALSAGTVVTALFVNFTRKSRLNADELDRPTTREVLEANLSFYSSFALTVAYAESVVFFFSDSAFLGTYIHTTLAKVISPLLALVFLTTGRHLLRGGTSK